MAVRLDPFQNIVGVGWGEDDPPLEDYYQLYQVGTSGLDPEFFVGEWDSIRAVANSHNSLGMDFVSGPYSTPQAGIAAGNALNGSDHPIGLILMRHNVSNPDQVWGTWDGVLLYGVGWGQDVFGVGDNDCPPQEYHAGQRQFATITHCENYIDTLRANPEYFFDQPTLPSHYTGSATIFEFSEGVTNPLDASIISCAPRP